MFARLAKQTLDTSLNPTRRGFLRLSAGAGAGLVIGASVPGIGSARTTRVPAGEGAFTPFVRISPDGIVTVLIKHIDRGQGTATGLATLVAEELDAAVDQITVEFAPANAELYKNLFFGIQGTGGSTAIPNSFMQYRQAGAAARATRRSVRRGPTASMYSSTACSLPS